MMGYFRLDPVRLVKVNDCHEGLEPPTGTGNRGKDTVEYEETSNFRFFL